MPCGDCWKAIWTNCLCCFSGARKGSDITHCDKSQPVTKQTTMDAGHANFGAENEIARTTSSNAIEKSSFGDFGKFRYSGRDFDVVDLGDEKAEDKKEADSEEENRHVNRLEIDEETRKSSIFKFKSTRRGAKRESVYNKFTAF